MNERLNFKISKESQKTLDDISIKMSREVLPHISVLTKKSELLTTDAQTILFDYCNVLKVLVKQIPSIVNFTDLIKLRDDINLIILQELKELPRILDRYKMKYALFQSYYTVESYLKKIEDKTGIYELSGLVEKSQEINKNNFENRVSDLKRLSEYMMDCSKEFDESDEVELKQYLNDNHHLFYYCLGILNDLEKSDCQRNFNTDIDYLKCLAANMSQVEFDNEYCSFQSLSDETKNIVAEMNELILDATIALSDGV